MKYPLLFALICATTFSLAQTKNSHEAIFAARMALPKPKSLADGVIQYGVTFIGNAYPKPNADTSRKVNGKIQLQPISKEVLVVNLKKFDCVTFVESMTALAQTKRSKTPNFSTYKQYLTKIRYRNGAIDYVARLHYFSDWIYENQKRGLIQDLTAEMGGVVYDKPVFYMTAKKDTFYGNMADPKAWAAMRNKEKEITARTKYYIPKEKVAAMEHSLQNGDIIAITNRLEGMDMAHTGFAYWKDGRVFLLHASSQFAQVMLTDVPLADYLARNKGQTGIMVARLKQ